MQGAPLSPESELVTPRTWQSGPVPLASEAFAPWHSSRRLRLHVRSPSLRDTARTFRPRLCTVLDSCSTAAVHWKHQTSSLAWLHRRLVGNTPARGGNVVVLRASDPSISYDRLFYRYAHLASVQTVLIPPCATRPQIDSVARIVDKADAVYFAGGDQAHYVAWKGTALMKAVTRVYARGGVVGGGSAGLSDSRRGSL